MHAIQGWRLQDVVRALCALRGIAVVSARRASGRGTRAGRLRLGRGLPCCGTFARPQPSVNHEMQQQIDPAMRRGPDARNPRPSYSGI